MGLIGPNGSGKTTTIKLILNMLKRNGGEIKIMGLDNSLTEAIKAAKIANLSNEELHHLLDILLEANTND